MDGMSSYAGSPSAAYWGRRFLVGHFVLEALVVLGTGWLLYWRMLIPSGIRAGFVGMLLLPVLHFFSMTFEIGYTVRGSVGGQMHEIDWVYRPWYVEKDERLAVKECQELCVSAAGPVPF